MGKGDVRNDAVLFLRENILLSKVKQIISKTRRDIK